MGALLWWVTPFAPWQAALISLVITLLGFAGGLCMSAIKRDRGVKDFGTMIEGHGGMMALFCRTGFFHLVSFYFA